MTGSATAAIRPAAVTEAVPISALRRQQQFQHGPPLGMVGGLHPTAVGDGDLLHDRQTQTTAAPVAAHPGGITAVEALEHVLQVVLAEAGPLVPDGEQAP